jgi:hypothetical protein
MFLSSLCFPSSFKLVDFYKRNTHLSQQRINLLAYDVSLLYVCNGGI